MRALVVGAALALTACGADTSKDMDDATRAAVRDSVTVAMRAYEAAVSSMDLDRIMPFYSNDSSFRVVDGQAVFTRAGIQDLMQALTGSLKSLGGGFNYDSLRVLALSPHAAVATAPYVDVLVDTAGVTTTIRGSVMWVWARQGDRWRIVGGQAAPSAPVSSKDLPLTAGPR